MRGTGTSEGIEPDPRAVEARVSGAGGTHLLIVRLRDGRDLGLPLWLYPNLLAASPAQRRRLEIIGGGWGVRWPDLDVDLSVRGMLAGRPDVTLSAQASARSLRLKNYARALAAIMPARRAG